MTEFTLEDIEFIKILASTESTTLQTETNIETKNKLDSKIGSILRQYYRENTMNEKTEWIDKFKKVGITEDMGKAAISCARRLGIEIS